MSQSIHNSLCSAIYNRLITDCLFHVKNACQDSFGRVRNEFYKGKPSCSSVAAAKMGKRATQEFLEDSS